MRRFLNNLIPTKVRLHVSPSVKSALFFLTKINICRHKHTISVARDYNWQLFKER